MEFSAGFSMSFSLPDTVALAGWIPFAIVLLLSLVFSTLYIRHFRNKRESEFSTVVTAVLAFAVTLLTSLVLPVDVFLVSYMKDSNGTYKDWADNTTFRQTVENSVLYAYYALYSVVLFFLFFLLPLVYFFYEEKEDDNSSPVCQRLWNGFKYTLVFLLLAAVLLLIGAFALPTKDTLPANATDWERILFQFEELAQNRGEDALSFILNILTIIGTITMVFYTGSGLSIWPIEMIKGKRSASSEYEDVVDERTSSRSQIEAIKNKYKDKNRRMTKRDSNRLAELEEEQNLMERRETHLEKAKSSWLHKCRPLFRPLQILLGIIGLAYGALLWSSLLLSNIDKALNSSGMKMGYALPKSTFPNPMDFVLVAAQKVFPIDYILFMGLVCFLVVCTISGIQQLGIWFFFLRMYKIRSHKTRPQALIMLCSSLMYTVLALNVLSYNTSPQYTTYGSQTYHVNGTATIIPCDIRSENDDCVMTRASTLLVRFFYKAWIFGAFYYWASWVFIGVSAIAFFVVIIRKKQSAIEGAIDRDDLDDSDDDLIRV